MRKLTSALLLSALMAGTAAYATPPREALDRGLSAFKTTNGNFVSWRALDTDPAGTKYEVYRDGVKIETFSGKTNFTDKGGSDQSKYQVKCVGDVDAIALESKEVSVVTEPYLRVRLDRPAGGTIAGNSKFADTAKGHYVTDDYTYSPNDCSVGDVDGDGEYEIFVKWDPSNSQDNSMHQYTSNVYIDCYKLDGTKLWRVDLGQNIRAGAHYTQFMVYDFDGDGKAEMICKTAPGTKDSTGKYVIMGSDDPTKKYANSNGQVISGPEYLTVFNGLTGEEINTIAYNPPRNIVSDWGDTYGGRSERYLAGVAYLHEGKGHSAVFCRGYYTYSYVWAVDFDGSKLTEHWFYASPKGKELYGEGTHSLTIGDVDGDGFDEIIMGSAAVDHDGKFLHRTGGGHGDALHMGDFDPDHPGLEIFMVHEEKGSGYKYDASFRDAKTGEVLWSVKQSGNDIGRGLCADLSTNWRGYECWPGAYYGSGTKGNATFDCKGNLLIDKRGDTNFRIYWDGDLLDELFDGKYDSATGKCSPVVTKRAGDISKTTTLMDFSQYDARTCNTTKATPCLQADIFGDWREELIMWDGSNSSDLLIFQSTIESGYMVPCLMTNHGYRMAIAWQNTAYNQPPHLDYYLYDEFDNSPSIALTKGKDNMEIMLGESVEIEGTFRNAKTVTFGGLANVNLTGTADADNKTFTISGTPKKAGNFSIRILSSGGTSSITYTVKINVVDESVLPELTEVAHYSFDEVGEYVTNHVEGAAKVSGSPTTTEGVYGKAILLNGSTDWVSQDAYSNIQLGTKDFTIEFWMRSNDDAAYILHKGSIAKNTTTGTTGNWIGLELKPDKNGVPKLTFAIDDDVTKSAAACDAEGYFNNEWVHVTMVRNHTAAKLQLYLNGVLVAEAADATGALADNNEPLTLGNVNVDYNNPLKGELDDFHIYHGAMVESQVKKSYDKVANPTAVAEIDANLPKYLTLVDAQSGIVIAEGVGEPENILPAIDNAEKGKVFILVVTQGVHREISKIVK